MKTNFIKGLMMPLAVAVLGIAGAFTTTSMGKAPAVADQMGYRQVVAANPCEPVLECTTDDGDICKSGSITLWGKTSGPCNVPLFKKH